MSVQNESVATGESVVLQGTQTGGVYASLFEKINLNPVTALSALDIWQDAQAMSDATADERLTAGMQVFLECLTKSGSKVEKLDRNLIDHHIAELDYQISRQLDAVMHHEAFQAVESLWCGLKSLVDKTDFRQNVKIELLDLSKDHLRQDFEDSHGFAGRGDICLFGEMLSRFFALYTDIYLFNRLIIILQPTGERLEWEEKHNRRIPGCRGRRMY